MRVARNAIPTGRLYGHRPHVSQCPARLCGGGVGPAGARKGFIRRKKLIDTTIA